MTDRELAPAFLTPDWPRGQVGVIVLAGGRGTRMAGNPVGCDKASVTVGGQRLLDLVVGQLPYGTPTAVVSPYFLGRPQVCEAPLFGGPCAGIARGAQALDTPLIAVLSVDAPDSPRMLPALYRALKETGSPVAVTRAVDGYVQPLCALWQAASLRAALESLGGGHNTSARRLIRAASASGARPAVIAGTGAERDYDTRAQLADFAAHHAKRGL